MKPSIWIRCNWRGSDLAVFVEVACFKRASSIPVAISTSCFAQLPLGEELSIHKKRPARSILPAKTYQLLTAIRYRIFVLLCPYAYVELARLRRQTLFNHLNSMPQNSLSPILGNPLRNWPRLINWTNCMHYLLLNAHLYGQTRICNGASRKKS